MEGIAEAAQVAKATAYSYFRSKEEVFHAVCESVVDRIGARIDAACQRETSPAQRVLAIVEAKFTSLYELVHSSPHAADLLESSDRIAAEIVERGDAHFLRALRQALRAHGVTTGQAGELALILQHAGTGISQLAASPAQLRSRIQRVTSALLASSAARR
jgi:AcrR family transcriptional regulator